MVLPLLRTPTTTQSVCNKLAFDDWCNVLWLCYHNTCDGQILQCPLFYCLDLTDDKRDNAIPPEDLTKTVDAATDHPKNGTTVNGTPKRPESNKTKKSITPHRIVCPSPDDHGDIGLEFAIPTQLTYTERVKWVPAINSFNQFAAKFKPSTICWFDQYQTRLCYGCISAILFSHNTQ